MKILHVIPAFYPTSVYGGPIESCYQMCRHLARNGHEVRVLTTDANGESEILDVDTNREVEFPDNLRVRYCHRHIYHDVSFVLLRLLPAYVRWADVVHLTAVYSYPTIPTLFVCKVLGKPLVWSPRGALQRWQGSTRIWQKGLWELMCRSVRPDRLILHVTSNEEERKSLERFPNIEIIVIPNGVKIPEKVTPIREKGVIRLLYLGRLHPIKGVENLLAACRILNETSFQDWTLTIAGSGNPHYAGTIEARIEDLALSKQVKMVREVVGEAKRRVFENSDIAVVPSYTENFGMVVAEALAHGVPVIASTGTPWRRLEEMGCGLWVDNDPESLAKAIEQVNRMPLREMGNRGHEWMEREFSWDKNARELLACYETLCDGFRTRQEAREHTEPDHSLSDL